MEETDLFCKDCRHYCYPLYKKLFGDNQPRCNASVTERAVDVVTGVRPAIKFDDLHRCREERSRDYGRPCGPEGVNWYPRKDTPANLMRMLKK